MQVVSKPTKLPLNQKQVISKTTKVAFKQMRVISTTILEIKYNGPGPHALEVLVWNGPTLLPEVQLAPLLVTTAQRAKQSINLKLQNFRVD